MSSHWRYGSIDIVVASGIYWSRFRFNGQTRNAIYFPYREPIYWLIECVYVQGLFWVDEEDIFFIFFFWLLILSVWICRSEEFACVIKMMNGELKKKENSLVLPLLQCFALTTKDNTPRISLEFIADRRSSSSFFTKTTQSSPEKVITPKRDEMLSLSITLEIYVVKSSNLIMIHEQRTE